MANLIEENWNDLTATYLDITRISIVGNGIMSNNTVLTKTMKIIEEKNLSIISMEINEAKISIIFNEIVSNNIIEELHRALIS